MTIEGNPGSGDRANTEPVGVQKTNPTADANKDANAGASTLAAMMEGSSKVTAPFTSGIAPENTPSTQSVGGTLKASDPLATGNKAEANQLYSGGNPQGGSSSSETS